MPFLVINPFEVNELYLNLLTDRKAECVWENKNFFALLNQGDAALKLTYCPPKWWVWHGRYVWCACKGSIGTKNPVEENPAGFKLGVSEVEGVARYHYANPTTTHLNQPKEVNQNDSFGGNFFKPKSRKMGSSTEAISSRCPPIVQLLRQ